MTPNEIRDRFLEFFEERDHRVVASSPVVPQGDPTLLFTNAGMNQFKDVLLGNEVRDYTRATSAQKCIRAGGKHNDLDEVGRDIRHLTFFEMLGNWSFGDYYKKEAIEWSWEFVTTVLELDTDRLYVTIYKDDDESHDIWLNEIGVPADRILRLGDVDEGDEENFWSMGPTGPCGPCTEIHYDMHPEGDFEFVHGYDDDRVVEFWNLVFMEFNRDETGELTPLPMQSVDTGMGLERVAMMVDGVNNIFQTDLFLPIVRKTLQLQGEPTEQDWDAFFAGSNYTNYAVVADHARSVLFGLVDGARFSNEGRGSVLRSILRRAVRFGRELGFTGPFVHEVSEAVVENFGDTYPELKELGGKAAELIRLEEERFFQTIDRGIELFDSVAGELRESGEKVIGGETVFKLHATYGFPPDLTQVMAEENGLELDWSGYRQEWAAHQEASKGKDLYADASGLGDWQTVSEGESSTFVGYEVDESACAVRKFRPLGDGERFEVILDRTPFYAESGGQIGDVGVIRSTDSDLELRVEDTQRTQMGIVHIARLTGGELTAETGSGELVASIDTDRRRLIESNHTATHLLHEALRTCVSEEVFQAGSLVAPDRLRFDFSHGEPLSDDEIEEIEERVNRFILEGHPVTPHKDVDRERAVREMGAMAIFGEKYGDRVRVVQIEESPSTELCGGTHVGNTRDIGLFRVTGESGVAAGIRRIEAVTNEGAIESFRRDRDLLKELGRVLKADANNLVDRARSLTEERADLERRVDQLSQKLAARESTNIIDEAENIEGLQVIAKKVDAQSRDQLLKYADSLREKLGEGVVLLGAEIDGKPALLCLVTEAAVKGRGVKAGDLINQAASYVGGRGGGRPTLAQAGGSDVSGLSAAVDNFSRIVRESLG